jgi:hypothetical protein
MEQSVHATWDDHPGQFLRVAGLACVILCALQATAAAQRPDGPQHASPPHGAARGHTEPSVESAAPEPGSRVQFQEAGQTFLHQHNWRGADESLSKAIELGAGPEAHLLRARALIAESKPDQARAEMASFLGKRNLKDLSLDDRLTWVQLDTQMRIMEDAKGCAPLPAQPLAETLKTNPELQGLEPARNQEQLPSLLKATGQRVEAFFHDFQNTSSVEQVIHEFIKANGTPTETRKEDFLYLLMKWPEDGRPGLDEHRTEKDVARARLQNGMIVTSGFASLAMMFLPDFQEESQFRYLGRQSVDGRETDVVAFAQRPETSQLQGLFVGTDGMKGRTLLQGIAWIDHRTRQIIRLRTDLLYPLPKLFLTRQTTDVRYAAVHFKKRPSPLWLPSQVVVTVKWKGKLIRNRHSYTDFRLFNVETTWKARMPKEEEP